MSAGSLKMWNVERGFGFIQDDAGGPDMFLHITRRRHFSGQPQARRSICLRNQQHPRWKDESQQCSEGVTPEPSEFSMKQFPTAGKDRLPAPAVRLNLLSGDRR
jgi:hypothetical protein